MSKHILSPQKLSNIRMSPHVTLPALRREKGETLRLLRTKSDNGNFESMKRYFQSRLLDRGYSLELTETIYMTDINFSSRETALQTKLTRKTSKNLLPFQVTTYNPEH